MSSVFFRSLVGVARFKSEENRAMIPALLLEDGREDRRQGLMGGDRIEDPLAEMKKSFKKWTEDEEKVFVKMFKKSPVNFVKISAKLESKSVKDSVQKYYIIKKNPALKSAMKYRKRRKG